MKSMAIAMWVGLKVARPGLWVLVPILNQSRGFLLRVTSDTIEIYLGKDISC